MGDNSSMSEETKQEAEHCLQRNINEHLEEEPIAEGKVQQEASVSSESLSTSETDSDDLVARDGGYGWIIVLASFFNAFIIDGIGSSFGLIFPYIVDKFGSSALVTSFAGSLFVAFLIMGSVSAELVKRFGFRKVSITGGILSCLSFVACTFSPNIIFFILTYGLLAGCSCGLVFLPSVVIVNGYFHQKRGIANGIVTSGSGAGLLILAPLINFLLEKYSMNGTILILSGILLNMCLFSSLYRPPPVILKQARSVDEKCDDDYGNGVFDTRSSNISLENEDQLTITEGHDDEAGEATEDVTVVSNDNVEMPPEGGKYDYDSVSNAVSEEHGHPTEQMPRSYLESMLPYLKQAVVSPEEKAYDVNKSDNQNKQGKNISKSEWHINFKDVQQKANLRKVHSSVYSIPTWLHNKDTEVISHSGKGHKRHRSDYSQYVHHHHHHHHRRHSDKHYIPHHGSHHQNSGFFSIDHGSNLYFAGSIATLKSLHSKHIIQNIQDSLSAAFAPDQTPSTVQIDVVEIPVDSIEKAEMEKLIMPHSDLSVPSVNFGKPLYVQVVEPLQTVDKLLATELHTSNKSLSKSGYTSLSELGPEALPFMRSNLSIPLPPQGYTISQLLHMPSFHLFSLGASLIQIGYPIIGTFLADYAYQFGLSTSHTAVLMGLLGGLNIIGRLLSGALASYKVDPLHLNNASLLLGGIACMLCPFYTEFWSLCLFAALFGFLLGFFAPLQPLIIVEYFGLDSLASAFGFLSTIKGVASILGAPLAGWIYDASGQYSMSFIFGGAAFVLSALVHCLMPCARKSDTRKAVQKEMQNQSNLLI